MNRQQIKPIPRIANIDIIKVLAVFGVITIHSFNQIGIYGSNVNQAGSTIWLQLFCVQALSFCLPLFLLATGYLMHKKSLSFSYYKKIIGVIFVYLTTSVFYQIYAHITQNPDSSFLSILKSIFNLSGSPYCWYVNLYIGLFLLIPFLNLIWSGLKVRKAKTWLCVALAILTFLPHISLKGIHLPDYWQALWPITYYFIGAYLKEFNSKIILQHKVILTILAFGWACVAMFYVITYTTGGIIPGSAVDWSYPWTAAYSIVLFSCLTHRKLILPKIASNILSKISSLTLGIYLSSAIFDNIAYKQILGSGGAANHDVRYIFITIPAVFIASFITAQLVDSIWRLINRTFLKTTKQI